MDRNSFEIELLRKDPGKLLLEYQEMIRAIVRLQMSKGLLGFSDQDDLVQEVNQKLLERMPKIQSQFNGGSKLRTYFSVIIRNICLEVFRRPGIVCEPESNPYGTHEISVEPVDVFLIRQECEKLKRVLLLMGRHGLILNILLRMLSDLPVSIRDLEEFVRYDNTDHDLNSLLDELNQSLGEMKKQKFQVASKVISLLGGKSIMPDSLRKWYLTKLNECLKLMNGNPPTSAYDADSLGILMEKLSLSEKNGTNLSN